MTISRQVPFFRSTASLRLPARCSVKFWTGITEFHACSERVPGSSFCCMVEEPISLHRAVTGAGNMSPATVPQVTFDRSELNRILTVYGRMVAAGEWRDYALDFLDEMAVFSVFRRAC